MTYKIMGILNVTPDSFYDGGRHNDITSALNRADEMIQEGADIIDAGGESTRPYDGGKVSADEEIKRVVPVIAEIRKKHPGISISIDTYKAETAKRALSAGADIINDISGLSDPEMADIAANSGAAVIIMHSRGTPQTMQTLTDYGDILPEIKNFFADKINFCLQKGIAKEKIIIDPGIGFAKTAEQNLFLIKNLGYFSGLGVKIMLGASRKSFIGKTLNLANAGDRLYGSLASAVLGYIKGADIFRVHDVKETKQVLDMAQAVEK